MGTLMEVKLACADSEVCQRGFGTVSDTLAQIDLKMSLYHESELTRINAASGSADALQPVSPDTAHVIRAALWVAARSDGFFDPTIAPLLDLFRFYEVETGTAVYEPRPEDIAAARGLVNFRNVKLSGNRAGLLRKGMKLDLGGVAKGYALDAIAGQLSALGIRHFSLNFGGHLLVAGIHQETIIQHPTSRRPWLRCSIKQGSLSASSQNERFVQTDKRRIGHIFHSRSVSSAEPNQVTVVYHESAMFADAWSTALFYANGDQFSSWARQNALIAYRLSAGEKTHLSQSAEIAPLCQPVFR